MDMGSALTDPSVLLLGIRHWYSWNRRLAGPLSFRKFQYDILTPLPPYRQHILHYILLINKSAIVALVAKALKIISKDHTLIVHMLTVHLST
jgi:hypothetical protein